jgi:hypothetical protein
VRLVVSVLVLEEVLHRAWHDALDVVPQEAHSCQKTLHNLGKRLLDDDQGAGLFERTTAKLIETALLSTRRHRQDSTHILSNIKILTRLGLFTATILQFLKALREEPPRRCEPVSAELLGRVSERTTSDLRSRCSSRFGEPRPRRRSSL